MKLLAIGVWVILVALGTTYGVAVYLPAMSSSKPAAALALQYNKTRAMNVPMIAKGVVQGFMVVQLGYTVDATVLKGLQLPPEVYLLDEAFRSLYADTTLDFKNLTTFDLPKFTAHLVTVTNERLGAPVLKDVLIDQFSYVSKDMAKG